MSDEQELPNVPEPGVSESEPESSLNSNAESQLDTEILAELGEDDGDNDPLTILLAIAQAAATDKTFGAGMVKYLLETMGRPDIWEGAVELAEFDPTDGDDEDDDPEPDDEG